MSEKLKFILSSSADFFGVPPPSSTKNADDDSRAREFLECDDIYLLTASKTGENGNKVEYEFKVNPEAEQSLLFYKIPKANSKHFTVGVLSVEGGLMNTIYLSLSRIFSPKISLKQRSIYPPEVATLLEKLQERISTNLGLSETGISTIYDELNYWNLKITVSNSKADRENAANFVETIQKIHTTITETINHNSLNRLEESIDELHNILDELWKSPSHFPQNRMKDILNVLAENIIEVCVDQLTTEDLWTANSDSINGILLQVEDAITNWNQVCDSLTRLFWPNYAHHTWLGEPHIPKTGLEFKDRLEEITNIKNLHSQISNMFDDDRNLLLMLNQMFRPFRKVNVFDISPIGTRKWLSAKNQFEIVLRPIDERIANSFQMKLNNHLNNPRQMMAIFTKFNIISQRPQVLELLKGERDHFLESLKSLVAELQQSLLETNHSFYPDTHISAICWECRWTKICEQQIGETIQVSNILQIDQTQHAPLFKSLNDLKSEVKTILEQNFEKWCNNSTNNISNGELSLKADQPVVEFEQSESQLMRVTFHPKLITFCYDVREFELQGFHVPVHLKNAATHAIKFIGHARLLQQVASFHNTVGDRMIPCQRPIMLKNAVELANLVKCQSATWNDEDNVKTYTSSLQDAVNKLSKDNAALAGYHEQIKKAVLSLMGIDLLKQSQIWKEEMRNLRETIATIERLGYTNLHAFKMHWDHQLYKVLEYQYVSGLLNLNFKLPDMPVEIIFRQQKLQFRPPMEEIRAKYFYQLRRFIERPLGFRGLSDQGQIIFKSMVERNRQYFGNLYVQAEDLFLELDKQKEKWVAWVSMGFLDLDEFCKVHLTEWEDWDRNFRDCKHFSQQIAKIQNTQERVHCFIIDLTTLRTDIELISRRFWEALSNSLRTSILNDISIIEDFIRYSTQTLQNISLDGSEIAEAGMKYEKIKSELPSIAALLKSVQGKDTCLAGWCKERVSVLTNIQNKWEQIQPLIDNHHTVLQRQIDMMKDQNLSELKNLTEEAEKFLIRWEATLKELESNEDADLATYRSRCQQWTILSDRLGLVKQEFTNYGMEIPQQMLEILNNVDRQVRDLGAEWDVYEKFNQELNQVAAEEWMVYRRRPYFFNEFLAKWNKTIEAPSSPSSNPSLSHYQNISTPALLRIKTATDKFSALLPILQMLQSEALTEKHWAKILLLINEPIKSSSELTLKDMLKDSLVKNSIEVHNIVKQANSELIVKQALSELEMWGAVTSLKVVAAKDSKDNPITLIKDYQEILNKIGDNQCLLQSARNSSAFDSYSDQAEIWESRLNTLDVMLNSLSKIQRKWIYLEPVFDNGTIRNEETAFIKVDKDFRYIMREIAQDPRALSIIKITNVTNIIQSLENQLARCQTALTNFILTKRNAFPRFYFLSDDDLLELLGQSNKETILQKHIKKLFPAVHQLGLSNLNKGGDLRHIVNIQSAEGDVVGLENSISIGGPVEDWLNKLESEIKNSMRNISRTCLSNFNFARDFLEKFPMQILCLVNSIKFTRDAERSITSMNLQSLLNDTLKSVNTLTNLQSQSEGSSTGLQIKIRALLLDLVHQCDVLKLLIKQNVTKLEDWHWLQQLRFYANDRVAQSFQIKIRMVYAEFDYSFEYLGNFNKLVNTKLTHKCYLTLTQAMYLGLGCNPFGPAGTGKTECVKSLGATLGRLVLVFNCNENIDSESIGLILIGLARSGAWGCFDEFNRLQEQTLSAISMQIEPLQNALKNKEERLQIMDQTIPLRSECGLFVTLNPAGEEYGARQKLPGNIQNLFRPVVMQQPEPKEISKVLLFVEGFHSVDDISNRLVELFQSCSKMLSPQRHYDWGLRELKTILTACGRSLQNQKKIKGAATIPGNIDGIIQNDDELQIVVSVLRTNITSKLTTADAKIFNLLLTVLFPDVQVDKNYLDSETESLRGHIESSFSNLGLLANQRQIEKCLELNEQLTKRMGVMVVGPPSCGKTTLIKLLKQALIDSGQIIRTYTICPKSMSKHQFLGYLDSDTRQWHDGVLTSTAIAVTSEDPNITSWIICDGEIDPDWIEALNSVLDDNKLLTLPSGWRIQFGHNVNFLFETHDLRHASPATISRMGIINVNKEDFEPNLLLELFYIKCQNYKNIEIIKLCIDRCLSSALNWLETNGKHPFPVSRINLIKFVLQAIYNDSGFGSNDDITAVADNSPMVTIIPKLLSKDEFCCNVVINNLACTLEPQIKQNFIEKLMFEWMDVGHLPYENHDLNLLYFNTQRSSIDIYSNQCQEGNWSSDEGQIDRTVIITPMVKSYMDILQNFLADQMPFLLIGPSGSGKSILLEKTISKFVGYQLIIVNCSAQLTPNYLLYILKENFLIISGVRGREYKPKLKKTILFLRNLNLLQVDSYGSSDVVELLLQLIHRSGFYSENLEWISVTGLQICGSLCLAPDEQFNKLSPRFLTINRFLIVSYPTEEDLNMIISTQFQKTVSKNAKIKSEIIIKSILDTFKQIRDAFTTDVYVHYKFTPKMLTKLIKNINYYPQESLAEAIVYEITEIFQNRLNNREDLETFSEILVNNTRPLFNLNESSFYFHPGSENMQITSGEEFTDLCKKHIEISNNEDILFDIPLNKKLLRQISSVCRTLSRPNTHLVMVGCVGAGRKASVHIAASICQSKLFTIQPVKNYSKFDFYNDIKTAMQCSALENQNTVLLIDFTWITLVPDILIPIEAILENSVIPDLFGEDLETVAAPLRNEAQAENYTDSIGSYFMKRVETNLHLVILLEREEFAKCEQLFTIYPALYTNTEMLWLPQDTIPELEILANSLLDRFRTESDDISLPKNAIEAVTASNSWYSSPLKLIHFSYSYVNICNRLTTRILKRSDTLKKGIEKLSGAHKLVDSLRQEAIKQEESLNEKRKLAAQSLDLISATMRNASDQKTDLLELKKKTQESSEKLQERKKAIEEELKLVEPLLKEASAAVGQIKTEALSEIRSLRAPPEVIRDILEGVLRLMGIRDTSWNSMKTFLAKRGVKEDIRSLDPARIAPENCAAVQKLLQSKAESFETKNAKRASVAAAPLASWVIANVEFSKVSQSIKPLEREQSELQRNLIKAESEMKALMSGLDDVDARVKELSNQLNIYTQEAAVLEIKLEEVQSTLKSAEILVRNLGSEYHNWVKENEQLAKNLESLPSSAVLTAIKITYLSGLNLDNREIVLNNVKHIVTGMDEEMELVTAQDQIQWESLGLTPDNQSMQNSGIIREILHHRYGEAPIPCILDPSECAGNWLQNYLSKQKLAFEIAHQSEERFAYKLELAIRFGKIIIIRDFEQMSSTLASIIVSDVFIRFNKKMLQVGNKLIDWHDDFKLVLITRLANIDFMTKDIQSRLSQISYTTTSAGFTDQLVSKSILLKQPELEERRIKLLENEGKLWEERELLQEKLLTELSTASGDVLKNESLISSLNAVKESSETIDTSLKESLEIRTKLQTDYNQYRKLCSKLANLFMGISKTYRISTQTFANSYLKVLEHESEFNENQIYSKVIKLIYTNLARTISKERYIELGLLFCKHAFPDIISDSKWESFITNFIGSHDSAIDLPNWIRVKDLTQKVAALKSLHPQLYDSLNLDNEQLWKNFMAVSEIKTHFPVQMAEFDKILITQILRPDLLMGIIRIITTKILNFDHVTITQPTISQLAYDSKSDRPVLILSDPTTDPSKELQEFVKSKNKINSYSELSVGKDCSSKISSLLKNAVEQGLWVCLKNIHLVPDLIQILESELSSAALNINPDFRLWIICESLTGFSDTFLLRSLCIFYELPHGLKLKVMRHFRLWEPILQSKKDPKWLKISFVILLFTATIQERRKFIPQGFTKWYDFGDSDLRATMDLINTFEAKGQSYENEYFIIQALIDIIGFGGRIDQDQDHLIMLTHILNFFSKSSTSTNWSLNNLFNGQLKSIPQSTKFDDYQNFISTSIHDDYSEPEYFGLATNTNILKDVLSCRNLLKQLRHSYFQISDQENVDKRIRPILNLWKGLTSKSSIWMLFSTLNDFVNHDLTPWQVFILSEIHIASALFNTIQSNLIESHHSLKRKPTELMRILSDNQIPLEWRKLWPGPKNATNFIKAVVVRAFAAEKRYETLSTNDQYMSIDFATIFKVDSYLATVKLITAKERNVSPYQLTIKLLPHTSSDRDQEKSKNHLSIAPIYIEGGFQVDRHQGKLVAASRNPKDGRLSDTSISPPLVIQFESHKQATFDDNSVLANEIEIPMYSNSSREKLISLFKIPVDGQIKDKIIFSGTALIVPEVPLP